MAAVPGAGGRREAAPPATGLARTAGRGGGGGLRDDPDPRLVECQGEAGTRLAARLAELAAGLLPRAGQRRAIPRRRIARRTEMATAEIYQRLRPLMFSIAYRMLGSVSEAEDIVQE